MREYNPGQLVKMFDNDEDSLTPLDLDDNFKVEPGDMLYKPLRKGQAILLNAGTVLTVEHIAKIRESGLMDDARRCIKKAIRDSGATAVVTTRYDAEIEKAQRIRESLSGLRTILWLLLVVAGGYSLLNQFSNLFYVYLAGGLFVSIVVTYLVSFNIYDRQTALAKEKSDKIKEARRRLEERVEKVRQEKAEEMRHRMEQKGFF